MVGMGKLFCSAIIISSFSSSTLLRSRSASCESPLAGFGPTTREPPDDNCRSSLRWLSGFPSLEPLSCRASLGATPAAESATWSSSAGSIEGVCRASDSDSHTKLATAAHDSCSEFVIFESTSSSVGSGLPGLKRSQIWTDVPAKNRFGFSLSNFRTLINQL